MGQRSSRHKTRTDPSVGSDPERLDEEPKSEEEMDRPLIPETVEPIKSGGIVRYTHEMQFSYTEEDQSHDQQVMKKITDQRPGVAGEFRDQYFGSLPHFDHSWWDFEERQLNCLSWIPDRLRDVLRHLGDAQHLRTVMEENEIDMLVCLCYPEQGYRPDVYLVNSQNLPEDLQSHLRTIYQRPEIKHSAFMLNPQAHLITIRRSGSTVDEYPVSFYNLQPPDLNLLRFISD